MSIIRVKIISLRKALKFSCAAIIILTLLLQFSCSNNSIIKMINFDKNTLSEKIIKTGIFNDSIDLGYSKKMLYTLSVPKIEKNEKVPFVIALHFGGQMKLHFSENYLRYLVEPGLRSLNAIIFAPDAQYGVWNDELSEAIIIKFLNTATEIWPIDKNKIIITGYSNGGIGTWLLIDKYPEKFSAAIPMASLNTSELRGKVPTYIIHGKRDELFSWKEIQKVFDMLNDKGTNVRISVNNHLSHYEANNYVPELQKTVKWLQNDVWKLNN